MVKIAHFKFNIKTNGWIILWNYVKVNYGSLYYNIISKGLNYVEINVILC